MSEKTTVHIEDRTDRWRFTCPEGHRAWEPTNHHFWCVSCARDAPETDGVFHALRDKRTGEEIGREEVRLVDAVGPFDRDLDREDPHPDAGGGSR